MKGNWTSMLMTAGLSLGLCCGTALAQTAGQDMHSAGHDTRNAAVDTGHATKTTTKKGYSKTKHGTKKVYHKTKHTTKKAWHGTENLGDRVADKPQTH
jgi:hypothetical protein